MFLQIIPGVTLSSMKYDLVFHPIVKSNSIIDLKKDSTEYSEFETFIGCTNKWKIAVINFEGQWLVTFTDLACKEGDSTQSVKIAIRLFTSIKGEPAKGVEVVLRGKPTPENRTLSTVLPENELLKEWANMAIRRGEMAITLEEEEREKMKKVVMYNFLHANRTTDLVVLLENRRVFLDLKYLAKHSVFFDSLLPRYLYLKIDPVSNLPLLKIPGVAANDLITILHYIYPNPNLTIEEMDDTLLPTAILLQFHTITKTFGVFGNHCSRNFCWKLQLMVDNGFNLTGRFFAAGYFNGIVRDEEFYSQMSNEAKDILNAELDKKNGSVGLSANWYIEFIRNSL